MKKRMEEGLSEDELLLIKRLKAYVLSGNVPRTRIAPPVSETDIVRAEAMIGFSLPPIVKYLYCEVGNGGFGPAYGLYPLNHTEDPKALRSDSLVTTSLALRALTAEEFALYWNDSEEKSDRELRIWPEKILPLCDWGCNISSYLDCSQPEYPVLLLDHNTHIRQFAVEAASFGQWLEAWLDESSS